MGEKFALKWNDFHHNVSKSFELLRNEDYLHDVTLVSDDHHQVTAHKLVLSASSEYFKNIFKKSKHSNPFLCLEGISYPVLQNVLDYIYDGEVQIYQEDLDRFLAIAQRFKLKGIQSEENSEQNDKRIQHFDTPVLHSDTPLKINEQEMVKNEPLETNVENNIIQINSKSANLSELDQMLFENMEKNSDGTYSCKMCPKTMKVKTHMKFHVETHIGGLAFPCDTCGKEFRLRETRRSHQRTHHQH